MDLSQSQDAPRAAPAAEDGAGLPRKLARARMPSPPCARNIFMDGPEDEPNKATQLTRRPPYVSRYRYSPSKFCPAIRLSGLWLSQEHPTQQMLKW